MSAANQNSRSMPLFLRTMGWIMLALFFLLSITLALTLRYSLVTFQQKIDSLLESTVLTLSESPSVRACIRNGACTPELITYLDSLVANTEDLDYITIADADSIRVYHIDPQFVGEPFEGGDQGRALAGEFYLSDAEGSFGAQHRAFAPVFDPDGSVIGFVMASTSHTQMVALRNDIYRTYMNLALILTICTLVFSLGLAAYLNRTFRGAKPEDLVRIYLTQNDVLNTLDEGLITLDGEGRIRLANQAASTALGLKEEILLASNVDSVLLGKNGRSLRNISGQNLPTSRPNILINSVLLPNASGWASQMLILKDKSELIRQAEQLQGTRHIVTALRANNHEFLNKLQIISGLLQMGQTEEAMGYIGNISALHAKTIAPVMQLIHNPNVAALILGKMTNMRELDIHSTLLSNSYLPPHSRYLSTEELVTVVGNLLENAIEAVDLMPADFPRTVTLQITEDKNGLMIVVSDSGVGMSEELLPQIYGHEFSTKSSGRGMGMALIRGVVDRHDGSIEVDTEPGSGAIFTLIFNQERGGNHT